MAELFQEIEGYLAKERERVRVPVKQQEQQIQAEAEEAIEEAFARRFRDLGW